MRFFGCGKFGTRLKPIFAIILGLSYLFDCGLPAKTFAKAKQEAPPPPEVLALVAGEKVYSPEASHFAIDAKTRSDLEIDATLLPLLSKYAPTVLGKKRIEWLLTHPYRDVEEIEVRQAAVRYLIDNPEVMANLRTYFAALKKGRFSENFPEEFRDFGNASRRAFVQSLVATTLASAFAAGVATGQVADLTLVVPAAQIWGLLSISGHSSVVNEVNAAFAIAPKLHEQFARSSNPLLQSIAGICSLKSCEARLKTAKALMLPSRLSDPIGNLLVVGHAGYAIARPTLIAYQRQIASLLGSLADLEATFAAAEFFLKNPTRLTFAEILKSSSARIEIKEAHHPYIVQKEASSIGNDLEMAADISSNAAKTDVLTGPNAGGKTTFLRTLAITSLMSQAGFPVAARHVRLTPMAVVTNFTTNGDSTVGGSSTFRSQSARVKQVFDSVSEGSPTLVLLDEILVGTSTAEHHAGERAVLRGLHVRPNVLSIVATHDRTLTELAQAMPGVGNLHVTLAGNRIEPGPSLDYNAFHVMEAAGIPAEVVRDAKEIFDHSRGAERRLRCMAIFNH
jgi:DNA mismatch repair ATPase MutS